MSKSSKKKKGEPLLISGNVIDTDMLNKYQRDAAEDFNHWFYSKKSEKNQIRRYGGCAGSGKSFFIQYLIGKYGFTTADCIVVAYTGQAVNILRTNGIMAKTIHSTFMKANEEPLMKNGKIVTKRGIPVMVTRWVPVKSIPSTIKLIIIDESSFLPESLESILAGYNVPILEIGDPVQLPPVGGKQCFRMDNLDYFIDGVMRQHKDSEIYQLSMLIRHGLAVDTSQFQNEVRFLYAQPTIEETFYRFRPFFKGADNIITSTNKQRQVITDLYRSVILNAKSPYPIKGERMICRKNDWQLMLGPYPLTNGTAGTCLHTVGKSLVDSRTKTYFMDFQPEFIDNDYYDNLMCDSEFLTEPFGQDKMKYNYNPGCKFEFAHAQTCHTSQGGQYNTVVFMDSFHRDEEYHMRLRYTGVTRAKKILYYIIPYSSKYPGWFDLRTKKNVPW